MGPAKRTAQAEVNITDREDTRGKVVEFPRVEGPSQERNLTAKQARFAWLVGYEELSFAQAYREAYNTGKMSPETVGKRAWEEAHKAHITARIRDHQQEKIRETPRDPARLREFLVESLVGMAQSSKAQDKDRLKAMELLGKTIGLFADTVEHKGNIGTDSEAMDTLRKRIAELGADKPMKS